MRHRLKDGKSGRHRDPGTVGVHMDPTQAGSLVYEALSAIFTPALPEAHRIVPDGGQEVAARFFDVRRQRPLSEPVRLGEAVRAVVHGRPKDIQRIVPGIQAHFAVDDKGFRDLGHGEQDHELVIGPKRSTEKPQPGPE
ncbi:hypothetical protein ACQEVG_30740 [Streptomyces sp. CA-135486]|uniref:hypothetical protein n=1 Tax=Streptomyces sp. CA-135486 TaxID=3240049 RepID=UPI003D90295F